MVRSTIVEEFDERECADISCEVTLNEQSQRSRAIYTVVMGGYEKLREVTTTADDDVDAICFTDDATLTSATWQIRVVQPAFPSDSVRSQRLLKIRGHSSLDRYESTLYIDNAVRLDVPAGEILDDWLGDPNIDVALPLHSYRQTVLDEFDELVAAQYDDPARLYEQLLHYSEDHADVLEARPYWTAIVARRSNARVARCMAVWADHILRYSRRDQLSARVALGGADVVVKGVEIDNFESRYHAWPVDAGRKVEQGKTIRRIAGPLVADLRRLRRENEEVRQAEQRALAEVERLRVENSALGDIAAHRSEEVDHILASTSWRLSAPLRYRPWRKAN